MGDVQVKDVELIHIGDGWGSHPSIRERISNGEITLLAPGQAVFTKKYNAMAPWEQWKLTVWARGRSLRTGVLCSMSAAAIFNLWIAKHGIPVEVAYRSGTRPSSTKMPADVQFHRMKIEEVIEAEGVRVTTLERTLADVARYHGVEAGVLALDSAFYRYPRLDLADLTDMLPTIGSRWRVTNIRTALARCSTRSQSPLETRARLYLEDARLPEITSIEPQGLIRTYPKTYHADLLINGRLVLEFDGYSKYADHDELHRERLRHNAIQNAGYLVRRFGAKDLIKRPDGSCPLVDSVQLTLQKARDIL